MQDEDFGIGLANPVRDAQALFRGILDALAHPGNAQDLASSSDGIEALNRELAGILLTLCDHDTPIWLSSSLRSPGIAGFVGFHTGAPIVADLEAASFAFVALGDTIPDLTAMNQGQQEYPDRSTTLVLALPALSDGPELCISGPGILGTRTIAPQGLPENFRRQWDDNRELYPRGIDLLLVTADTVMGLPRSSNIVEG